MFAELHVQWFQLLNEWDALEAERLANIAVWNDYQDVINSINVGMTSENWAEYVRGMIADLEEANENAADAIAAHNIAIAQGNVTVEQIENEIADLEAQIAALDDIIAAAVALANNYKALMEANLAS
jgi:DNA gyrase/topoisomerase IV subunit A